MLVLYVAFKAFSDACSKSSSSGIFSINSVQHSIHLFTVPRLRKPQIRIFWLPHWGHSSPFTFLSIKLFKNIIKITLYSSFFYFCCLMLQADALAPAYVAVAPAVRWVFLQITDRCRYDWAAASIQKTLISVAHSGRTHIKKDIRIPGADSMKKSHCCDLQTITRERHQKICMASGTGLLISY